MDADILREDALFLWGDVLEAATTHETLLPWLQRVVPVSFDGSTMKLVTKQKWTERKLMGEYRELVESIMSEITMEPVSLVVEIGDDAPGTEATQAQSPEPVQADPSLSAATLAGLDAARGRSPIRSHRFEGTAAQFSTTPSTVSVDKPVDKSVENDENSSCVVNTDNQQLPETVVQSPVPILEEGGEPKEATRIAGTDFTFDTYIVGESNTIAYNMAMSVAEQPDGSIFNPLFIWGPSGNGKTHLLLAIKDYIGTHQPQTRVRYVTSNAFVTQYVDDIRNKKLKGAEVLREYRDIDVLLVDDVQFFEDKQESVTAFFDIFNDLMMSGGKQIVLAADRAPDYLRLDSRMKTRFNQGMVADIKAPTYEMKLSILRSFYDRCRARNGMDTVLIGPEAFEVMATCGPDNPRNMQGLVNNIMFRAEANPGTLTPDGIKDAIETMFKTTSIVSITGIMKVVATELGVSIEQICSDSRVKTVKEARQVVMWLASQLTDEPYTSIGDALNRDHSTVSHGIKKVNERREQDKTYLHTLEDLKNKIVQ